jgi:hypothetical protein
LQRAAKRHSQRHSAGSKRGRMYSGASGVSIIRSAVATMPGAASGGAWLGVMVPQLPCELPLPAAPASITRTPRPASASARPQARPTTPAPTTITSSRCMRAV